MKDRNILNIKKLNITAKLLILILAVSTIPLFIAGVITYISSVNEVKQEEVRHLLAQTEVRANRIAEYFQEKKLDISLFALNPYVISVMEKYIAVFDEGGTDSADYKKIDGVFRNYLAEYKEKAGYYDIFFISPVGDIVFTVVLEDDFGTNLLAGPYKNSELAGVFNEARNLMSTEISQFKYYPASGEPAAFFAVPVKSNGKLLGVVAAQMSTSEIYEFTQDYTSLGETGEVVLASRIGNAAVFLNPLRHDPEAAFKREAAIGSANAVPIQKAVLGRKGSGRFLDYRGIDVLAAWSYISALRWGIVVKIDAEEAFKPVAALTKWFLLIGIITVLIVAGIAPFLSRAISMPIIKLKRVTDLMAGGDLSIRAEADTEDEIGILGSSFNKMIEELQKSRDRLELLVQERTAELEESNEQLQEEINERRYLEKALLEIEERERRSIGSDLHDDVGQMLTGISFKCNYLESSLKDKSVAESEDAARITLLIDQVKNRLKLLSRGLHSIGEGEENLINALKELASSTKEICKISCDFRYDPSLSIYNKTAVTPLYRIAQEAVSNAVKHGKPERIEMALSREDDNIKLIIRDNGTGIDENQQLTECMGFKVMNYRADIIGGSLHVDSEKNRGTEITCTFPDKS
jgi:signal transduction histidine kinase